NRGLVRVNNKVIQPGDDASSKRPSAAAPSFTEGAPGRSLLLYGAMLLAAVVLFLAIDAWGKNLAAPEAGAAAEQAGAALDGKPDALVHVLIALTAVLIAGQLLGWLFRYI